MSHLPDDEADGPVIVSTDPLNAETPAGDLAHARTPSARSYVRTNFGVPVLDPAAHVVRVAGPCARPSHSTGMC